jgi:hypothetical protein
MLRTPHPGRARRALPSVMVVSGTLAILVAPMAAADDDATAPEAGTDAAGEAGAAMPEAGTDQDASEETPDASEGTPPPPPSCDPACGPKERCTPSRTCVRLSSAPPPLEESAATQPPTESSVRRYRPSRTRVYAGPAIYVIGPAFGVVPGVTATLQYHADPARVFYAGARGEVLFVADGTQQIVLSADVGWRPRVVSTESSALAFLLGTTLGFGVTTLPLTPLFHLTAKVGVSWDLGPFTMQVTAGPGMFASVETSGSIEAIAELGARF